MEARAADFVFYNVTDFERAVSFYRDTLGLESDMVDEDMGWAEFALPPTTLAIGESGPETPLTPGGGGVGVAVAVTDVEAALEEIRAEGMTIIMDSVDTGVCDMAVVGDPDDNPIMLHRRHDDTQGRRDPLP